MRRVPRLHSGTFRTPGGRLIFDVANCSCCRSGRGLCLHYSARSLPAQPASSCKGTTWSPHGAHMLRRMQPPTPPGRGVGFVGVGCVWPPMWVHMCGARKMACRGGLPWLTGVDVLHVGPCGRGHVGACASTLASRSTRKQIERLLLSNGMWTVEDVKVPPPRPI
jgi:hypothetical protein